MLSRARAFTAASSYYDSDAVITTTPPSANAAPAEASAEGVFRRRNATP